MLIVLCLISVTVLIHWHTQPHTSDKILFSMLATLPRSVRATLMGLATGTRGSNVVYYADTMSSQAALTIDDVPSKSPAEFTALLTLLAKLDVRASMGVIAANVASQEGLLRAAVAQGHQLLNHGVVDDPQTGLTETEFEAQLEECQALIHKINPTAQKWYRPPNGLMDETMRAVLRRKGYRVVLGDCYSADPQIADASYHVNLLSACAQPGSIMILHSPERGHRHQTLQIVAEVAKRVSMQLVTLDELFSNTTLQMHLLEAREQGEARYAA